MAEGSSELVIDFGPGYRVYFGLDGDRVVLLGGGDKSSQPADIGKVQATLERIQCLNERRITRDGLLESLSDAREAADYLEAALQE